MRVKIMVFSCLLFIGCFTGRNSPPIGGSSSVLLLDYVDDTQRDNYPVKLRACKITGEQLTPNLQLLDFIIAKLPRGMNKLQVQWLSRTDSVPAQRRANGPDILTIDFRSHTGTVNFSNDAFYNYCLTQVSPAHFLLLLRATVISEIPQDPDQGSKDPDRGLFLTHGAGRWCREIYSENPSEVTA